MKRGLAIKFNIKDVNYSHTLNSLILRIVRIFKIAQPCMYFSRDTEFYIKELSNLLLLLDFAVLWGVKPSSFTTSPFSLFSHRERKTKWKKWRWETEGGSLEVSQNLVSGKYLFLRKEEMELKLLKDRNTFWWFGLNLPFTVF